jgi:hypothetical protein
MRFILVFVLFSALFSANAHSSSEAFDPKIIQFYKVDSCKVYVREPGDHAPLLTYIYVFNPDGTIHRKMKLPFYDDEDTLVTTFDYVNGLLVRALTLQEGRTPQEILYAYRGRVPVRKVVKFYDTKDYEIFTDDEGTILSMVGSGLIPEKDSITGEPTGKSVVGQLDEYEFRYNRFKKKTKEVYYYMYQEYSQSVYDYGPNGNQPLLSKTIYKMGNKVPDLTIHYTYGGNSLLLKEESKDGATQGITVTEYEYIYHPSSMMHQPAPVLKSGPSLSPVPKKGK